MGKNPLKEFPSKDGNENTRPRDSLAHFIFAQILSPISNLIPKNSKKVLFFSEPDYSDNAKFLYRKMVETGLARRFHLIWAFRNEAGSTGNFVRRKAFSSAYLYHFLTAKYIIGTHGVPYWKSRKQISILLW